jgi:hypothetical protein
LLGPGRHEAVDPRDEPGVDVHGQELVDQ